jgi:hypothetical protein
VVKLSHLLGDGGLVTRVEMEMGVVSEEPVELEAFSEGNLATDEH